MFATIINDCRDQNAMGRQTIRVSSLLGVQPTTIGIENETEAAGNLIDCLDAASGRPGVILVNVAPRHNNDYPNGVPFCYVNIGEILVLTTASTVVLGLIKKMGLAQTYQLLDIPAISGWAEQNRLIDPAWASRMTSTQFRSYEFLPWMASIMNKGWVDFPHQQLPLPDQPLPSIWYIDCFGNAKTTALQNEITPANNGMVTTELGQLKYYNRLKDVPDHEAGLVVGSSGIADKRFLEIVVNGQSAAAKFNLKTGQAIFRQ